MTKKPEDAAEVEKTAAGHPLFPAWRYRQSKDGAVDSQLFETAEAVPAKEGWVDSPAKLKKPQ